MLADQNFPITFATAKRMGLAILRRKTGDLAIQMGSKWVARFMTRQPELRAKIASRIEGIRVAATEQTTLEDYFTKLADILQKYHIPPHNIYNLDEKGFMMGVAARSKVIVRRHSKIQATLEHNGNRELVTVVECICADGTWATPLVIYKGRAHYYGWYPSSSKGDFSYGYSEKGYIDHDLLLNWLREIFEPRTRDKAQGKWRLMIWDGHESHMNLDVLEFCLEHQIIVLCLPSHCTHILQPLDVCVFGPYQHNYSQEVDAACRLGKTGIGKHYVFDFLAPARTKTFHTQGLMKKAFQTTGIHPYIPTAVYDRLSPPPSPKPPAITNQL